MHVFVTGATGWIGSAVTDELLAAGHVVTGLARSDAAAATLTAKGVTPLRGDLEDLDALRRGAAAADAVAHLGYRHDWSDIAGSGAIERRAVTTFGEELAGTGRPFVLASGVAGIRSDGPATEADPSLAVGPQSPRGGAENLALGMVDDGLHAVAVRFAPSVHGTGDHGFVAVLAELALRHGVAGYPGDGSNRWSAVHRSDAARLVVRALESAPAGARLHGVAETEVPTRAIAEALGSALGLPTASVPAADVEEHFGWIGMFVGAEMAATSEATRALLGWEPTGPGLAEDIAAGAYAHVGRERVA